MAEAELLPPENVISLRDKIDTLEREMYKQEQVHMEPTHTFADGLYAREITIPKGVLLTGKIHNAEHINIISKGEISVLTEDGPKRIKAPCTIVSRPGTKRVGYAHEDTVWTTIHAIGTLPQDVEALEAILVCDSFEHFKEISVTDLLKLGEAKCHT